MGEQQLCCYRILNALYALGTSSKDFVPRSVASRDLHQANFLFYIYVDYMCMHLTYYMCM